MSTERGRIEITGFDPDRVRKRENLSDWVDESESDPVSRWRRALRDFRRNRSAMFGFYVVVVMALIAFFARPITVFGIPIQPISLAPWDPSTTLFLQTDGAAFPWNLLPGFDQPDPTLSGYDAPTLQHPMGTDRETNDLMSRVMYGGRYSISIGFVVVGLTSVVGVLYGAAAGYYGGWIDDLMMRFVDLVFAFPGLVLALIIVAVLGGGYWQLVAAFAIPGWAGYARLIRGEVLKVKENEYVMAAKALGARDRTVILRHVVPNAITPVIVQATLSIGTVVIGVAALGFLGVGFTPDTAEWGTMLDQTRETLIRPGTTPWWATIFPGMAIFIFVMCMNLIGDGINDALNAQETVPTQGGGG